VTPPRPSAASARQRLLNHSRARGEDFQRVLVRYGLERLLYRLSASSHADQFVLKGAMLFALWTDTLDHRSTKDLDLLGRGPPIPERLARIFREVCDLPVEEDDGVDFEAQSITAHAIREDVIYDGIRVTLEARLGQARLRLQVDVGFGDAVSPPPQKIAYPTLLGHPAPEISAYRPETVIAEKLHAMVTLGIANSRMKDFFDVRWCSQHLDFDCAALAVSLRDTFASRGTPIPTTAPIALTSGFASDSAKQAQWRAFVRRSGLAETDLELATVVDDVAAFLLPVVALATGATTGTARWSGGGPWVDDLGEE